jgi:hypothetical protein
MFHPADFKLLPEHEQALTQPFSGDPEVAETFNIWLYDGKRNIGINVHPRATGGKMMTSVTVFLPDGRIARANHGADASFTDKWRPEAPHVKLHCVEPLHHWELDIDDLPVYLTSDAEQASRTVENDDPVFRVSARARIETVAPAWINGALLPESRQTLEAASFWFGNRTAAGFDPRAFRYDQLIRGDGRVRFEGADYDFDGVGLRGHVRGVRRMPGMVGHTWAEGYCPETKRGFGTTMFLREGGGYVHSEGFLFENGKLYPARAIHQPKIDRNPANADYVFELACDELGLVRILGTDVRAFWWQMQGWGVHAPLRFGWDGSAPLLMKQGIGCFRWENGDIGYGLVERSGGPASA